VIEKARKTEKEVTLEDVRRQIKERKIEFLFAHQRRLRRVVRAGPDRLLLLAAVAA